MRLIRTSNQRHRSKAPYLSFRRGGEGFEKGMNGGMPPDAAATSNLRERDRICVCRCMMSSYELGYLTLIRIVEGDSQSAKALNSSTFT